MSQTRDTQQTHKSKKSKSVAKQSAPQSAEVSAPLMQSALADPLSASPQEVMQLQRRYGNRAIQRLIQRAQSEDVQREAAVGLEGGEVNGDLQNQIDSAKGGGRPLDHTVGDQIGGALGADFSGVKVHTDSQSDTLNRSLSAKAFTTGSDIFFSQGAYNPGTHGGKELLAHELTHVVQQGGGQSNTVQTKLTVGPAGDKYEEEADQVASQVMRSMGTPQKPEEVSLGAVQRSAFIQRKSDKLKQKTDYTATAKGGFKLFGAASKYDKVLNAVAVYHGLGGTQYMAQLQQLVKIAALIDEWEISHGTVDSGSKNKSETARRGVLATLRSTDIPEEISDVYQQAKSNNDKPDVKLLMLLMDAAQGKPSVRGQIEQDYATALRSYQAGTDESKQALGQLSGSSFFAGAGGSSLSSKLNSVRSLDDDPTGGLISSDILDAPIKDSDSDTLKQTKQLRKKLQTLIPAVANMSDAEIMAISAYTDEGGYTPMVGVLRGGRTVSGGDKKTRKENAKNRKDVQQANLMAASALNKLPDWDGSMLYRGEDVGWLGHDPTKGETVVLKSFTSTAAKFGPARHFAQKGTPETSAVWNISNVTNQGKDIADLSLLGHQEAEVLLKPYTRLRIDNVTQGDDYRFNIEATAL